MPLPWYSFLYRLFGAQGTFWLWIIATAALWWTAEPALIRISNRHPQECELGQLEAQAARLTRWVRLRGVVELTLDRSLLLRREPPGLAPVVLLVDADDPAAARWVEAQRLAEVAAAGGPEGEEATRELAREVALLSQDPAPWIPAPERAVLVQDQRSTSLGAVVALPLQPQGDLGQQFARDRERFAALVRERVRPDAVVEGLLLDTPQAVTDRLKAELDGLRVSPYLIQPGRQPRDLESIVFAGAAIVVIFLAGGLWGATRVVVINGQP